MKFTTLTINPWFLIRNILLLFATLIIAFLLQSTILVSPSHPFVDDDRDGIDDFEESSGKYADPNVKAQVYGVTFPIAELGNCGNYSECRSYCEDPVNQNTCIDYGRGKGFYQGEGDEKVQEVLSRARTVLGCDSAASCLNFCEIPANFARCSSFAQNQGLSGGYVDDPSKTQVITKAKEVLGCDSATGCQSLCSKEENRQKCSEFAKTVGLQGGERQVGPGGCTSEATCKALCSDPNNYQVCSGFSQVSGGTFTGPGGCNSEESCRTYCQQNEQECSKEFGGPGGGQTGQTKYNPAEMCNRTPNCAWQGNTCQCGFYGETNETREKAGEYAAFCQSNPDKCKPGQQGVFENSGQRQEFESYCSQNPEKCKPPTSGTSGGDDGRYRYGGDPSTECTRYGCTWTGSSCQCSTTSSGSYSPSSSGTYTPPSGGDSRYPSYSGSGSNTPPSSGSYTPPSSGTDTPPSSSGTYTPPSSGSYTPPSQPSEPVPAPQPQQQSQPTQESAPSQPSTQSAPPPSYTPPSGVQGVSTAGGLLQVILEWLRQ